MKKSTFLFLTSLSVNIVCSQIIHIPDDFATIQSGINSAEAGDTILVAPGEYFENINFSGKNIVVCSNFAMSGNVGDIETTIINGSNPVNPDTSSCVLIVSGEDSTAVLQGFTVTGGNGTRWEDEHGPGLFYTEGGGFLIQYSSPTIKNNIIRNNKAINVPAGTISAGGGAIRSGDGNPHILNNLIVYNQGRYGGGIVLNYSGAEIKNNIFAYNTGGEDYGGGGLWFLSNGTSPIILENNTIVYNHSALGGGGIRLWSSQAQIRNNIIWGNTAVSAPQIQGNTGTVTYCCVQGGWTGTGNLDTEPLFATSNFILDETSECVDAGNPDPLYDDPEDPDNAGFGLYPAMGTVTNDMGVFGGPGCIQLPEIVTSVPQNSAESGRKISILGNPVSDGNIVLKSLVDSELTFSVKLKELTGKLIFGQRVILGSLDLVCIYSGHLSEGLYIIQIEYSDNSKQAEKLIVR
jgi:hypothetical protein